jgi:hypothetical protein
MKILQYWRMFFRAELFRLEVSVVSGQKFRSDIVFGSKRKSPSRFSGFVLRSLRTRGANFAESLDSFEGAGKKVAKFRTRAPLSFPATRRLFFRDRQFRLFAKVSVTPSLKPERRHQGPRVLLSHSAQSQIENG